MGTNTVMRVGGGGSVPRVCGCAVCGFRVLVRMCVRQGVWVWMRVCLLCGSDCAGTGGYGVALVFGYGRWMRIFLQMVETIPSVSLADINSVWY